MTDEQKRARAAIDIGSNTIHIVVARGTASDLDILADEVDLVRIGESVTESGEISEQKRDEAVSVLRRYKQLAEGHNAHDILSVATEAIREAKNSDEFLELVKRETGLDVCLIGGDVEAVLTFYGATYETLKESDGSRPVAVLDLGGGSAELITAHGSDITWLASIPIGSGWLHDRYLPSNPPTVEELEAARAFLHGYLQDMQVQQEISTLIATGGSANSLLFLAQRAGYIDAGSHQLAASVLKQCEILLTSIHAEDIAERYGQEVGRTRILPAGCLIIQAIMERFQLEDIQVNPHGIREGVLLARERYGEQWLERVQDEASHLNQGESQPDGGDPDKTDASGNTDKPHDTGASDNVAKNAGDEPFIESGRDILHERVGKLLDWRGEVLKDKDTEAVHKMRVASRRLRAALDAFEPCCKAGRFKKAYREVQQMADLLGRARDTDVMLQKLQEQHDELPFEEQAGVAWLINRLQTYRQQQQDALEQYFDRFDERQLKQRVESSLPKGAGNNG